MIFENYTDNRWLCPWIYNRLHIFQSKMLHHNNKDKVYNCQPTFFLWVKWFWLTETESKNCPWCHRTVHLYGVRRRKAFPCLFFEGVDKSQRHHYIHFVKCISIYIQYRKSISVVAFFTTWCILVKCSNRVTNIKWNIRIIDCRLGKRKSNSKLIVLSFMAERFMFRIAWCMWKALHVF